jgi:hypothetical protein
MLKFAHDIAGGQGNLIATSVQSPNFKLSPFQGWQITRDGTLYAANAIISGTITASVFDGTDFEIDPAGAFFYDPVSNNIVASIAPANGTNRFSDPYLQGVTSYFVTPGFVRYALNSNSSGGSTALTWLVDSGSGFTDQAQISVTSSALTIDSSPGALPMVLNAGAQTITLDSPVTATAGTAAAPTLITTDNWHNIALDAGWTAGAQVPQYRLLPDGNVQVRGQATHAGTAAAVNINNSTPIPAVYWPGRNRVYRPPVAADSAGTVQISTTGVFAMRASGFTATQVFMDGIYSI